LVSAKNSNITPADTGMNLLTLRMSDQKDTSGEPEENMNLGTGEITSVPENEKSLIETMEVHHHPDLHHKKKKFREYFAEFIMIFLAVTLGFFAEGLREHISENTRAKEYARMLLNDVVKDTVELRDLLVQYQNIISNLDTLQQLRQTLGSNMTDFDFWYYSYTAFAAGRISFNEATMQQVKNSGNLRYFHNLKLKEKIGEYDNITRAFALRLEFDVSMTPVIIGFNNSLFDYDKRNEVSEKFRSNISPDSLRKLHYHFLTRDADEVNRFLNFTFNRKSIWKDRIAVNLIPTLKTARDLISLLKTEYDFSDDD
jgi:hypothetical protein